MTQELEIFLLYFRSISYLLVAFLTAVALTDTRRHICAAKVKGFLIGNLLFSLVLLFLNTVNMLFGLETVNTFRTYLLTPAVAIWMLSIVLISFLADKNGDKKHKHGGHN